MALGTLGGALLFATLGLLLLERGAELVLNRRHVRWLERAGAVFHPRDGLGLIVVVQSLLFVLLPLEALSSPWAAIGWWTWPLLALALAAQGLRYWVITTLGPRWCIRVATLPGKDRILGGPYRWMRHPNYVAVATETLVLPLAFGAYGTAALLSVLQAVALARRIRCEDHALRAAVQEGPSTG